MVVWCVGCLCLGKGKGIRDSGIQIDKHTQKAHRMAHHHHHTPHHHHHKTQFGRRGISGIWTFWMPLRVLPALARLAASAWRFASS